VRWRTAALVGAAVTVVGDALTCLAHGYLPILVLRVLTGLLGEGILYPLSFVVLGQTRDPDRSFGIALSYSVGFLAAVQADFRSEIFRGTICVAFPLRPLRGHLPLMTGEV